MMHKSREEYQNDPRYYFDADNQLLKNKTLLRDRDRVTAIDMFNKSGLLDDAILFIVSDHGTCTQTPRLGILRMFRLGDMRGEHGEKGHGQKEGSWWNEKTSVPFYGKHVTLCFFARV